MPRCRASRAGRRRFRDETSRVFFSAGANHVAEQPNATADLQQRYRQFLDLMPLTLALAGLPTSELRLFNEEQIEARAITIRAAYRVARNTAKECLSGS